MQSALVQQIRIFVTLALRAAAILMLLVGFYGLIQAGIAWIWFGTANVSYDSGFTWIGFGCGYAGGGIALAWCSAWLVRWLVPVRRQECPQCGYGLKNLATPRCPECGLPIEAGTNRQSG